MALLRILLPLTLCFSTLLVADDAEPVADAELQAIEHLQSTVTNSGCEFQRNGKWYKPEKALSHMNRKYQYVLKRGGIKTADDFIRYAATESSMSGKLYMVRCPGGDIEPTGEWLHQSLSAHRQLHGSDLPPAEEN